MADVNTPVDQAPTMAPPIRTNDQILPHIRWVPIGKRNCYLDVEKSQSNPIYKIAVDILKHTNFFRAFTASSIIPSIYIQQFWDTIRYDKTVGCYKCQLDEQWFNLTKDTLKDALQITPVNNNQAFTSPSSSDALINFVNELGYLKLVRNLSNVVTNDMFQPWKALTTIINMCLTRKTSGFESPRALVLQILWGIINRAHLDYAERIWEEFTQSIHKFIEDKKNLVQHTHEKKKATLIMISSIRFTKLIIYHLQRKHKFHPRPDSLLHLPNEEPVLGYLKFSAKGTKREVFGMPIPGNLITADIQGESYYKEYLAKVAKHQRYMAGGTGSDSDSPAPKPLRLPSQARKSKSGLVTKRHKPTSSLRSVDESVAEDIPEKEPRVDDEEANVQRALEESLKSIYDVPRGPLPPVVIREPESGKYQPLPEVQGKGKVKVTEEQVARDLPTLQTPKKKSPTDQYIFQRRTSIPTGSSGHDESSSLYAELGLMDSEKESDKDMPRTDAGVQEADNDKATAETEAESMVSVTIQQDTSLIPPMTIPIIDLTLRLESPKLEQRLDSHGTRLYTLEHLDIPHQVSKAVDEVVTDMVDWAMQAPLRNRFKDLPEADMKEMLRQRMWEIDSYKTHEDHMQLYEALEKSMNRDHSEELLKDLAEARKKKKKRSLSGASGSPGASGSSQVPPPPPPPPSTNQEGQSKGSAAPSSSKTAASAKYQAWTTNDTRLRPPISLTPADLQMDDDMAPNAQAQSSDNEDIENAHIPKVNLRQDWWKPLEEERPATPEPAWSILSSDVPIPKNNWASALASTYSPPPEESLLAQTSDIAMFMDWFCKIRGITELKPQNMEGPVSITCIGVLIPTQRTETLHNQQLNNFSCLMKKRNKEL
nr:monodehydroascorbate reductase [Tanacetum cinerariifolium]